MGKFNINNKKNTNIKKDKTMATKKNKSKNTTTTTGGGNIWKGGRTNITKTPQPKKASKKTKKIAGYNRKKYNVKPKKSPKLIIDKGVRASYTARLREILDIQSKTYDQEDMLAYIFTKILEYGGEATFDEKGNLYGVKGEATTYPCVVSHTDTVHRMIPKSKYTTVETPTKIFAINNYTLERVGVGGDDNVGIFLCLEALKNHDVMKVAFFIDEEHGCLGSGECDMSFFDDVAFAFQGDRQKYADVTSSILGTKMYDDKFKNLLTEVFKKYGKTEASGGLTDVYTLANKGLKVCGFNSSCGYYNPHSPNEYVIIDEVILTYLFFQDAIGVLYRDGITYPIERATEDYDYTRSGRLRSRTGYMNKDWWEAWDKKWDEEDKLKELKKRMDTTMEDDEESFRGIIPFDDKDAGIKLNASCPSCLEQLGYDHNEALYYCYGCEEYYDETNIIND